MNNATVSDTKVSFAASLYEAFRRLEQRCGSFAMAELSDQKVQAIGASRMDGARYTSSRSSGSSRSMRHCRNGLQWVIRVVLTADLSSPVYPN
jgi:hypothetical protein